MKIIVITEHNELDAYQNYMEALVNDGKDYSPVVEMMLESMKLARKHPEHIETETDGFQTVEVQTTEYGGCEFRAEYDSETMVKLMNLMTEHRDGCPLDSFWFGNLHWFHWHHQGDDWHRRQEERSLCPGAEGTGKGGCLVNRVGGTVY